MNFVHSNRSTFAQHLSGSECIRLVCPQSEETNFGIAIGLTGWNYSIAVKQSKEKSGQAAFILYRDGGTC
jgi:hypothetical protein